MRQLLVLGFYCEVYRREPLCRIYVNDILLDEFDIPHTPIINTWGSEVHLDPAYWSRDQIELKSNPLFFKFLELDDAGENSMDIRVEIQNNDNNYANGFMTRYSRVKFRQCWLAPVKMWEEFDQIQDRWKFDRKKRQNKINYIVQYYPGRRNYVFDNFMIYADMHFPDIKQQPLSDQCKKGVIYNGHFHPQLWKEYPDEHWVGSSGHYRLTLVKKLGFWRHSTDRRRGWWKLAKISVNNVKDLYDKYKQYEDTRSIDQ